MCEGCGLAKSWIEGAGAPNYRVIAVPIVPRRPPAHRHRAVRGKKNAPGRRSLPSTGHSRPSICGCADPRSWVRRIGMMDAPTPLGAIPELTLMGREVVDGLKKGRGKGLGRCSGHPEEGAVWHHHGDASFAVLLFIEDRGDALTDLFERHAVTPRG